MPKSAKSQWDFGELFPVESTRKVLTVSDLTGQVKRLLEQQVGEVWVNGEVTNFRAQSSGHIYFAVKDLDCQLSCVLFRNEARESRALVQDGRKLILRGQLTVYEPRGQYQLRVTAVELEGLGALQQAFEQLKQKLSAEGMFAPERKRPLPPYPQRIGLITSPTGAAIRDVLHVVQRRNPALEIILVPCRVQGEGAAAEIADALRLLNDWNTASNARLDLILLTRGGGSLEDLWAFNEEVVARAIFDSRLPVVSAVGHEIDFTISDFVADGRAATPSAAAEIITEGVYAGAQFLREAADRLRQLCRRQFEDKEYEAAQLVQRLIRLHPRRRLNESLQRLDDLQSSLARSIKLAARERRVAWRNLHHRLARIRPRRALSERRDSLQIVRRRLHEQLWQRLRIFQNRHAVIDARLRLLGPEQVLGRGYSITMDADTGAIIRDVITVKSGQSIRTRLKSGEISSIVQGCPETRRSRGKQRSDDKKPD
jgi:exodeoxyribonuclease VII large subunit